jgi:O-antigen/teichoic acid export membrane protein
MPSCTDPTMGADDRAWRTWLQKRIPQQFRSGILHNATWMLTAQGLQLSGRFAYFVIAAHALGPAGYGTYIACTALIATMSPFASLGTGHVLIKYVARDRNVFPAYFGNALLVTVASGLLLTALALMIRPRVLPASATPAILIGVAIADLFGSQVTEICLNAFAALEQFRRYTQLLTWATGLRVIAALVLAGSTATPLHWAYLYAGSAAMAAITGLIAVSRSCSSPCLQLNLVVPSVREGFHFSTSAASQSVYNDIDKTMLARLSTVESAAIYAVAYRFVDAAMLPVRSIAAAAYPEFFRRGTHGVTSTFKFARRILRPSAAYGIAVSVVLFVAAGFVPVIMGRAYAEGAIALRYLCLLPVIKSAHSFLTDVLTGANYQWQRSSVQVLVAVVNVLMNLWIIRAYSWRGAAWSSLATDALLALLLYIIIRWHLRRERAQRQAMAPRPALATGGE